jgi:CubicO group peptidase (beta-lactamase class C family)
MGTGGAVDIEVGALMVRHCSISVMARALAPVVVFTTACGAVAGAPSGSPAPSATLASAPAQVPPPSLTQQKVDAALSALDGFVQDAMRRTGVPGVSVAVVYKDKVVYLKGFGVRKAGAAGAVNPDTVFQVASLSKPISSTVVAGVVGRRMVAWNDPVVKHEPKFALADPWVSGHVTLADLFSHRSGLPDHAGDLLEDLGYDRAYILQHLRREPLTPFRASYAYTNFGLTEAAVAVAKAAGTSWEDLAATTLYRPLGMKSTSSRFADYKKASNRALTHVKVNGTWQAKYVRDPDAQSPAGGVSSTARDMTQWIRLQLGNGRLGGKQVIDAAALAQTYIPEIVLGPPAVVGGRIGSYGLGWDTGRDDQGRLRLSHSGAFALGAATTVTLLPSEGLGIVVLTNGSPIGLPEAVSADFLDYAQYGKVSVNWLGFVGGIFEAMNAAARSKTDYSRPPAKATPAQALSAYTGTYANSYYGPMTVATSGNSLVMSLGPKPMRFTLQHYKGDTFSYQTTGENAVGLSGVTFAKGPSGTVTKVKVEHLNDNGLGTFTKPSA